MSIFNRLTIKARLILLVTFAIAGMGVIGLAGLNGMGHSAQSLATVYHDRLIPTGQISQIIGLMRENRSHLFGALQHDPATDFARMHNHPLEMHTNQVETNIERISNIWREYMATYLTEKEKALAEEFARTRRVFVEEGLQPTVAALNSGDYHRANEILLKQVNPAFAPANAAAEKLFALQLDIAKGLYDDAEAEYDWVRQETLLLIAAGIILLAGVAWYTIRNIGRAVEGLDSTASALAAGDLAARVDYSGQDELGHVAQAFNRMGEKFQTVIREVSGATTQLASAAEETSAVTEQTTAGIREQQTETDQVATAMTEMNATVHEVAQNAGLAAQSAHEADEAAADGKRVVTRTIDVIDRLADEVERAAEAIHQLEQESESIGTVLDVIRGIAEQTNLLALNAAIEAARAGEQGRGFAVVADEVRTLAQRTQQSTQEIQDMIERLQGGAANAVQVMESSRSQAQEGVKQAAEAGGALDTITAAVGSINDMNTQIASAAEEQSSVAEDISRNVTNISNVAQQTSSGADQTAAASQELARLAERLQGLVSRFRA